MPDSYKPVQDRGVIAIRGARQNSLKNLDVDLPLNELVVVTGVSGSGKSSLVFDTLYAEGQRRYVETFSPYARQFLDRMDKPQVDRIEGIPPAIAIDQTNPVRTSRSTVGTMTELADHLKLLFARASALYCRACARAVRRDNPDSIYEDLQARARAAGDPRLVLTFPVPIPGNFTETEILQLLEAQGYTRIHSKSKGQLEVVQDRFRFSSVERARVIEALEAALRVGNGNVTVHPLEEKEAAGEGSPVARHASPVTAGSWKYSTGLHCPDCDIHYREPSQSTFSFNSPVGACETCRGFGRVIGVDYGLVIPDESKALGGGAVKPWQTQSFKECQDDLEKYAKKRGIPLDKPWRELSDAQKGWVIDGEPEWVSWKKSWPGTWYGVKRYFDWLETKAYKMHIRVLLSRYRAYTPCATCEGSRLKPDSLLWRVGNQADADGVLEAARRYRPREVKWTDAQLQSAPGLTIHDLMLLPVDRCAKFFATLHLPTAALDEATELLLGEVRSRLSYLQAVGLGYLTLDRQSRTLSGGEVQRINLTTALGTSLTNTLFVLDEPSIGLHPRDMGRVISVMQKLRDAGNSLVVVEHDPQIMFAADRILDMGPGPGEKGGEVVFFGRPPALAQSATSLTGDYLRGRRRVDAGLKRLPVATGDPRLELLGATEHNLKDVDVAIPLNRLVCVTGVSGSGKSTLVQDVLHPALLKHKGKPTEAAGAHRALAGADLVGDVVMVDQTPIGRTTRSNPASYVGAFDAIRDQFARSSLARERGYKPGMFSFNSGDGRCPTCGGNGFEHVEMQFLSDVYLRCPDCNGRRFRDEILEVTIAPDGRQPASIADVLEMTVSEAVGYFASYPEVLRGLQPLADVGLEYLKLGQPVPTLSGGEAQRLKLAGHLAQAGNGRGPGPAKGVRGNLFLFDEPTTGLHFEDIAKLLRSFRRLVDAGHSLLVIEHNLDVIAAADWIVDLGPEGGEAGGQVVFMGTPAQIVGDGKSHTGVALKEYQATLGQDVFAQAQDAPHAAPPTPHHAICVRNAREHNLKNIDVDLPLGKFTVITGVSGSGKSTLAFDIVFGEGQRRYLESLNAYARQFVQVASRPEVDAIYGIPPTVAIEQRTSRGGRKSTVGTLTEIHHFLRLLFVKLGVQHCPDCHVAIEPQSAEAIAARILRDYKGQHIGVLAPLVVNRKGVYTDLAKWANNRGHTHLRVDGEFLPTQKFPRLDRFKEHSIELPVADLRVSAADEKTLREALHAALEHGKGVAHVIAPLDGLMEGRARPAETVFSTRRACPSCGRSFPELDPRLFSYNSKHGWCPGCYGTGLKLDEVGWDEERARNGTEDNVLDSWIEWLEVDEACPQCDGRRLNPEALAVEWRGQSIADYGMLPVAKLRDLVSAAKLQGRELEIARDLMAELGSRLGFLSEVGLDYLTLDRSAPTLSGGEAQRIRLAAQLGSNLRGVCYILDEPTIGLHPRDNRVLLDTLEKLEKKGNTLLVVEHDEDTIRRAHHVIDLGPGAGRLGGEVIAQGNMRDLMQQPASLTGRFLRQPLIHPLQPYRPTSARSPAIQVVGANLHNLRNVDARFPLARLSVVTGVSGSGKSTLARDILHDNLVAVVGERKPKDLAPAGCRAIKGWEAVGRVLEVDQTPIGKTPRSCPATYVGFWDAIRKLFAGTQDARMRGYDPGRFSFNTAGGRCDACEGQGVQKIEMSFLPDVKVACDVCNGARFNPETLAVRYKGKSAGEVLAMSVDEAVEFFSAHPSVHHALRLLQDVGLGYLTLGQQSPTLSGGEAQRIKLVTELAKVRNVDAPAASPADSPRASRLAPRARHTLYVLDEPTVGLHMADVEKLIRVLHRLVDAGNTVVVIEHNLDVWADADWIVDLGPEGGEGGGRVVAQGTPGEIAAVGTSHTGRVLGEFLRERGRGKQAA
ncbi:MAG TPA: excinuclease ABC subunit UvrA [Burkholderiales bacterium]|nr:excinuclease ABC subunit UvrA [Burkholderiales bacterium]